jgi:hypothetical protein
MTFVESRILCQKFRVELRTLRVRGRRETACMFMQRKSAINVEVLRIEITYYWVLPV